MPKTTFQDVNVGNLHGWFKKGETSKVILFCHGNAGNISHRQDKALEFIKMGHSIMLFDYSGFGKSKGVPSEQLLLANGDAFFNFLTENGFNFENIIPYGESMGATVASYLGRKYNLPKIILESSLPGISYFFKKFNYLAFLKFLFNDFDTFAYLKGYRGKTLVLHSIEDEIIPYEWIDKIKKVATIFIEMKGGHNNPEIPWKEVQKFVDI